MRKFNLDVLVLVKLNNYFTFVKPSETSEDLWVDENDVSDFLAVLTRTFLLITVLLMLDIYQQVIQLPSTLVHL